MKLSLKIFGLISPLIKIMSLIFGYSFWLILVQSQKTNYRLKIPICFYNINDNLEVVSSEFIKIEFKALRKNLYAAELAQNCAIHIDLAKFNNPGKYKITLKENQIFLHNKIKLLNYNPTTIDVEIKEKK